MQCHLWNQGPAALLWNSSLSLFSCLLLPSLWPNPNTTRIGIAISYSPVLPQTWTQISQMSHSCRQLCTQSPRICPLSLSPSCLVPHNLAWYSIGFLCVQVQRRFQSLEQSAHTDLPSTHLPARRCVKYKDVFSCTFLGSKPSLLLSKFLVYAFLDPLQLHPTVYLTADG